MSTQEPALGFWTPILYDVADALGSVENPELRVDRVLELMRRFVPYDRCALLEAEPVLSRRSSIAPELPAEEREAVAARAASLLELISERMLDPMHKAPVTRRSRQVHLAVPIIGLGETTGLVLVERDAPPYEESHLAFLSVIAAQIGAYLAAVRADRALRVSEARFRGLYESGMIGIAFLDGSGTLTDANQTFASIVERPRAELQDSGANWYRMSPPDHLERDRAALREAIEAGRCSPYEKHFLRKDRSLVTVLAGAARLETRDSLVAFVVDISEQKRIETERAGLLQARETDLEFLEMFMGMLGHDLRNPLGAIRMSAQLLGRRGGAPSGEALGRILSSTDRMDRMVEQLLDLTRIRLAGGMPVEPEPADLAEVCRHAIDELKAKHPGASIDLQLHGDTTGSWDSDRLLQVASNLVANAIEHARGSREVTVVVTGEEAAVELSIHNPGAIPEDLLPVLFDPFRGSQGLSAAKGLGLGLFISKHIVESHGGSVQVDSSEARGTTFTVRLPRET